MADFTYDLTAPRRKYDLMQAMALQAAQPGRNTPPAGGLAKIMQAYIAAQGMQGALRQEKGIIADERRRASNERASLINAAFGAKPMAIPGAPAPGSRASRQAPMVYGDLDRQGLARAMAGSQDPATYQAGLGALLAPAPEQKAPTIKPFATGATDEAGNPMFQDKGFINGAWVNMGSPYPKRGGVTVNTGEPIDPFIQAFGSPEAGMRRNPDAVRKFAQDPTWTPTRDTPAFVYQFGGSKDPVAKTLDKFQAFEVVADRMNDSIDRYERELRKYGTKLAPGAAKMSLTGAYASLQLEYKELEKLGVLAGPDMMLIERVLQDPATLEGVIIEEFGGLDGYFAQLDLVREKIESARNAMRRSMAGQKWSEKRTIKVDGEDQTFYKIGNDWFDNPEGK